MIKIIQLDLESIFVVEKYLFEYLISYIVRGRSALRDPICYFLLCAVSQGLTIPYQFLENRSEHELHAVLRTEIMRRGTCLDSFQ